MLKKSLPYVAWCCLTFLVLLGGGMVFLQSTPGQKWVSKQVNAFLSKNLKTDFRAKIRYRIPDWLEFQQVYLADQQGDSLIAAESLRLDLDVWDLWQNKISVDQIVLKNGKIRLVNENYAFLLPDSAPADTTSSGWPIQIDRIKLTDVGIEWKDPSLAADVWIGDLTTGVSILPETYEIAPIRLENSRVHVTLSAPTPQTTSTPTESSSLPDVQLVDFQGKSLAWSITQLGETGWQTSGEASQIKAHVKSIHLPSYQAELEDIQGDFPKLAWQEERVEKIKVDIPQVRFSPQQQYLWVRGVGLTHPKGLTVQTGFQLTNQEQKIQIDQFHLSTPESVVRWSGAIQSPTLQPWTQVSPQDWQLFLDNPVGKIAWRDLHVFFPELLPDQRGHIRFSHFIRSQGKSVALQQVRYEGPAGSRLDLAGRIRLAQDWKQISGLIQLNELTLPDARWHALLPKEVRNAYHLPGNIQVKGQLESQGSRATWNLKGITSLGNLHSSGSYWMAQDLMETQLDWKNVALGKLIQQDSIGLTSGRGEARITKLLKDSRAIQFSSVLEEARYGTKELQQISLAGQFQSPRFDLSLQSNQPGLAFDLQTEGSIQSIFKIQGSGFLRDIDLQKWGGTPSEVHLSAPISWSGQVPLQQPMQAVGYLQLQRAQWQKGQESTQTQPMRLEVRRQEKNQIIDMRSSWLDAQLAGHFSFDGVTRELTRFLSPYFHLQPDSTLSSPTKEQFTLTAELRPDPWLALISNHRISFQPLPIRGSFDSEFPEKTTLDWDLRQFQWDSLKVNRWRFALRPEGDSLRVASEIQGVEQGTLRLNQAKVAVAAAQDQVRLGIQVQDSLGRPIHRVGLLVAQEDANYRLAFDPTGWQIYYENFYPITGGHATWSAEGMKFDSLGLRSGLQELIIHSAPQNPWQQWLVRARDISLKTWTATFLRDTTLIDGLLQANVTLVNPLNQPTYVGDISIENLAVFQVPLGTFEGHSTNRTEDEIAFDAVLKGAGNEVTLQGTYDVKPSLSPIKADLEIERLTAATLQAFSMGQLRQSKGHITGSGTVSGSFDNPSWEGAVRFHTYQTTVALTGTTLQIDDQQILARNKTILLDRFQIQDTLQNVLTLRGSIKQMPDDRFRYELNAQTKDFLATNARRTDNAFFFGTAYLDADMQINGFDTQYQVRGNVRVADKTRLTAYMPADEQVGSELNQLISFVPPPNVSGKKAIEKEVKRENTFDPSTLSLNLSVSEKAELTLIMDEMTGDYLRVRGSGQLTTGLDAQGELFILGRFNVKEGMYRMTYQVFERQFVIDESSQSSITWRGNPTDADIQITASYKVNKPLATYPFSGKDLTKDPRLQRQVPLSVDLVLKGDLMAPQTAFALSMSKEYVDRQLGGDVGTLLEDEGFLLVDKDRLQGRVTNPKAEANAEKIKEQAIYMLMFGRFDILGKRLTSSLDAEGFARKQVSQLISDQLDRLASDIIKGVDLDVGVQSESGADHSNRSTNLNLGVKKAFLNDRVSISVGKNFELESAQRQSNEIFDHLTANYNITRDGRYRFKAFRSNQYQIEGFVVETGVGFVLTLDYDDRRDIFRRTLPKSQP